MLNKRDVSGAEKTIKEREEDDRRIRSRADRLLGEAMLAAERAMLSHSAPPKRKHR